MAQIKLQSHMRYISRVGKLKLEDQDGNKLSSTKEQKNFLKHWSVNFDKRKQSRDTMHLVLSTPPGTNRENALNAAKQFLKSEYKTAGHEYVFVLHNDTDHPHVHAVINMKSSYGKKLDPRKSYLRQIRKKFAEICREHGIDVEASSRAERGLPGIADRSEFVHMRKTNRTPKKTLELITKVNNEQQSTKIPNHPSTEKMRLRNQIIRKRYAEAAKLLVEKAKMSSDINQKKKYTKAAYFLNRHAKNMPNEITRSDKIRKQIEQSRSNSTSAALPLEPKGDGLELGVDD